MRQVDLFFNYKYTFRFLLLISSKDILNSFNNNKIQKIVAYFSLKDLIDLNDVRLYNYYYFFKFFFGVKPFLTRFRDISTFRKTEFTFNIQFIFHKTQAYQALYFILNDVLPFMGRRGFESTLKQYKTCNILVYEIQRFNVFLLKKTNLGLLNLIDSLNFKIYFNSRVPSTLKQLFFLFKM